MEKKMKKGVSDFEIEKIREQCRLGKSVIDISKHLGIRKRIVEEILKNSDVDTLPSPVIYKGLKIRNVEDLKQLIILTIEKVGNKLLEPKIANSVFYGTSQLGDIFKILELKDLEKRICRVEEKIKCRA